MSSRKVTQLIIPGKENRSRNLQNHRIIGFMEGMEPKDP